MYSYPITGMNALTSLVTTLHHHIVSPMLARGQARQSLSEVSRMENPGPVSLQLFRAI